MEIRVKWSNRVLPASTLLHICNSLPLKTKGDIYGTYTRKFCSLFKNTLVISLYFMPNYLSHFILIWVEFNYSFYSLLFGLIRIRNTMVKEKCPTHRGVKIYFFKRVNHMNNMHYEQFLLSYLYFNKLYKLDFFLTPVCQSKFWFNVIWFGLV